MVMDLFGRRGASSLESSDHDGQAITAASGMAVAKGGQMLGQGAAGMQQGIAGGKGMYSAARAALNKMGGSEGSTGAGKADLPAEITAKA